MRYALLVLVLSIPSVSFAQGLSMSVTPTLFEMSAVPLQAWSSSVKVINNNPTTLTVYADVVNFAPQGETGQGKFLPVFEEFSEGKTLAEWITVPDTPFVIPPESSVQIPVQVNVPEDAAPGGHFAAILVGTRPPEGTKKQQVSTSQIVTSLFFVRIAGDVIEKGDVRTFVAEDSFVDTPQVTFTIRFENKGNVHLLPQGQIVITNMWGKERGVVPINYRTNFGNVLPNSIRKFEFTWKGEQSFTDIGRYKAELTLGYGVDQRQFTTQSTYFWVIPIKPVLTVLGILVIIIGIVFLSIRAYVRRVLALSGVQQSYVPPSQRMASRGDVVIAKTAKATAPLSYGMTDLHRMLSKTHSYLEKCKTLLRFIIKYKLFFISILLLLISGVLITLYFSGVSTPQRNYEVTITNEDNSSITLSSEEIIYDQIDTTPQTIQADLITATTTPEQPFILKLINAGETPGAAARTQKYLEERGYTIDSLESDFQTSRTSTVIVYDTQVQEEALALSRELGGVILSANTASISSSAEPTITVRIGNEHKWLE